MEFFFVPGQLSIVVAPFLWTTTMTVIVVAHEIFKMHCSHQHHLWVRPNDGNTFVNASWNDSHRKISCKDSFNSVLFDVWKMPILWELPPVSLEPEQSTTSYLLNFSQNFVKISRFFIKYDEFSNFLGEIYEFVLTYLFLNGVRKWNRQIHKRFIRDRLEITGRANHLKGKNGLYNSLGLNTAFRKFLHRRIFRSLVLLRVQISHQDNMRKISTTFFIGEITN